AGAVTTALPMGGASTRLLAIDGRAAAPGETPPTVWTLTVSRPYFAAIGVQLVRGRGFDDNDGAAGAGAAIVNQRFVQMFFPDADVVGHHIRLTDVNASGATTPP